MSYWDGRRSGRRVSRSKEEAFSPERTQRTQRRLTTAHWAMGERHSIHAVLDAIERGQRFLVSAPWMAVWPGLAIFLTVLSFNLVGDGLRDALDPRSR